MATLFRLFVWLAWLAAAGWLWHGGRLGTASALALGALSLVVFAWPGSVARRRHAGGELRYVEVGKEPIDLR